MSFPQAFDQFSTFQEIKAYAELVLDLIGKHEFILERDGYLVVEGLAGLRQCAHRLSMQQTCHPLSELKIYFAESALVWRESSGDLRKVTFGDALLTLNAKEDSSSVSPLLICLIDEVRDEVVHEGPLCLLLKGLCQHQLPFPPLR
jgi:hypothetical protein